MTDPLTAGSLQSTAPGSENENVWHREWMRRTENAYEWWYFDAVSKDGAWNLVIIFLIGSPFSPYARECQLRRKPDPLAHNGVFVALHRNGRLHHYLYARYPADRIFAADSGALRLDFGPSSWREKRSSHYTISLDEENANRRRITGTVEFESASNRSSPSPHGLGGQDIAEHNWLSVMPAGRARVDLAIHAPGESQAPERVSFEGSAYHDHNWGVLPFDRTIDTWLWARADFGRGDAAVLYRTVPRAGGEPRNRLILQSGDHSLYSNEFVEVSILHQRRNGYFVSYPDAIRAETFVDGKRAAVVWRFGRTLESTPFYIRCRAKATLETDSKTRQTESALGEILRPRGMGAWLVAHAMRLRIYEPGL